MFRLKSHIRTIVAVFLIIFGITALILWEGWGRENILYAHVLVAKDDIKQGQEIEKSMFETAAVPLELVIDCAIKQEDIESITKKVAKQYIPAKAQINKNYIYENDFYIGSNESIYYIPAGWIESMSTSVRRGDTLEFWKSGGNKKVGEFKVAFAKGIDELEVKDNENEKFAQGLERVQASGIVTHVEIIASLEEYKQLYEEAMGTEYVSNSTTVNAGTQATNKFLLVQKF